MANNIIETNVDFINDIIKLGGGSLKKCFQCATCSVVCNLSSDDRPFPRKEMIWAQWGLQDKLLSDPDIWRCYQCGDCSVYCPRDAKPAEVMAAIRNYSFKSFAFPKFMGKALSSPKYLLFLFALPVILFLVILQSIGALSSIPGGPITFTRFDNYVDVIFITLSVLVLIAISKGVITFWRNMDHNNTHGQMYGKNGIYKSIWLAIEEVLTHTKFKKCDANNIRYPGHLSIFYGFVALFVVTAIVFIGDRVFGMHLPMNLTNPIKILANLGAIALIIGCFIAFYNRLSRKDKAGASYYYDWLFLSVLFLVGLTGLLTEIIRLSNYATAAYWTYFVHLTFVFFLIGYFPYSKFAHLIYRFVAIVYSKYAGLSEALDQEISVSTNAEKRNVA